MVAIKVENLSKKYTIGAKASGSLRETLVNKWHSLSNKTKNNFEEFWALKNISFEVKKGEVLGIIGKNGAGKSTLLKVLSRITEPTSGRFVINGRVSSLLEVGTGFHPELTGRENIYLNGTILGMTSKEVKLKFDEIVDFSGVEKFIDTPVKHYSSGMYVRLAFAVAAHLEPEILIIDEVLAVGDAEFQKKCLGKMKDVSEKDGRTVLFVSHNLQSIQSLCNKAILIKDGKKFYEEKPSSVISLYLKDTIILKKFSDIDSIIKTIALNDTFELIDIKILQNNLLTNIIQNGDSFEIEIKYKILKNVSGLRVFFDICDNFNNILIRSFHDENYKSIEPFNPGIYISKAIIPENILVPINYEICIHTGIHNQRYLIPESGIRIPINVINTSNINQAYSEEFFGAKLTQPIKWVTNLK